MLICRKRVLGTMRALLASYGKGRAPRILITGEAEVATCQLCLAARC
jgi:hypothetical protein